MTRKRQVATCFLVLMGLLSVVFRLEIKDSLVALSLFARRYSSQDGQSWWHFLNDKARNDWWYINTALRRFDFAIERKTLCYQWLLEHTDLPGVTERMVADFESGRWHGAKELSGTALLYHRTGDVKYLKRMFDVVIYPDDMECNHRFRHRYLLSQLHCRLPMDRKYWMTYPPRSSADFPELFYQEAHELWLQEHKNAKTLR